jgi:hypothetical protein
MSNRYRFPVGNSVGVQYVPTVDIGNLDGQRLQVGQWVKRRNHPKPSRLAPNGHLVHPSGGGPRKFQTVSNTAFRLACGKSLRDVLGTAYINATPTPTVDHILQLIGYG